MMAVMAKTGSQQYNKYITVLDWIHI